MNAMGMLGSYITRGVYEVSGTFHPFGGAVDIIVVQQPDGSFKSSPWYVRFGKFQGVLKTKEKIVSISVNGVEAGIHMYLDFKGEAHFLKEIEVEEEEVAILAQTSEGVRVDRLGEDQCRKAESCNYGNSMSDLDTPKCTQNKKILTNASSQRSRILGLLFGRRAIKQSQMKEGVDRVDSLERAEIAANLLELRWSTNIVNNDGFQYKETKKEDYSPINSTDGKGEEQQTPVLDVEHDIYNMKNSSHVHEFGFRNKHFDERTIYDTVNLKDKGMATEVSLSERVDTTLITSSVEDSSYRNSVRNLEMELHFEDTHTCTSEEVPDITAFSTERNEVSSISTGVKNFEVKDLIDESIYRDAILDFQSPYAPAISHDKAPDLNNICDATVFDVCTSENGEQEATCCNTLESLPVSTPLLLTFHPISSEDNDVKKYSKIPDGKFSAGLHTDLTVIGAPMQSLNNGAFYHSRNVDFNNFDPGNISQNVSVEKTNLENGISTSFVRYPGNQLERDAYLPPSSHSLPISDKTTGSDNEFKPHRINMFHDSQSKCSQRHEVEDFNINKLENSYLSDLINISHDSDTTSISTVVGAREKVLKNLEDDQFLFSNIDDFGPNEIKLEACLSTDDEKEETQLLYVDESVQGNDLKDACSEDSSENLLDGSITQTCPMTIPSIKTYFSPKSLPAIRSYIDDLERSNRSSPLSTSFDVSFAKTKFHLPRMECSTTLNTVGGSEAKEVQDNCIYEVVASTLGISNGAGPKDIPFFPIVELSLCGHLLFEGMGLSAASEAFNSEKISMEEFRTLGPPLLKNEKLVARIGGHFLPWSSAAPIVLQIIAFGKEPIFKPQDIIMVEHTENNGKEDATVAGVSPEGSWKLWPFGFKRSKDIKTVQLIDEGRNQVSLGTTSLTSRSLSSDIVIQKSKNMKKKVRWFTPSSEELASLNLKEGSNVVTFRFSTAMLGQQQVDARIYLWKWNTQIVISDVDGTITRSDVLGQFMPLVGLNWLQTGVAHLFSAIKENGYQLLFLSARAISQAYLTRQFLFNLKQDGKVLPDGPVVISPDGLFPSLYREVIRRAPHEFKISCLEAIRELFPTDCNPFYAGFGNRDTDEISYLKVGIPRGKIFTINTKGEVAVNRSVDTKSYTSLHALVNDMFPPVSWREQEDFNSWNYWKMPFPEVSS